MRDFALEVFFSKWEFAAQYNLASSYSAMEGFIAAKVMTEALRRAGPNPTAESLIRAMEKMSKLDVGGFVVDFLEHGAEDIAGGFVGVADHKCL